MSDKTPLEGAHLGPSSKFQIVQNNKRRAKPTVQYEFTPTGPVRKLLMTQAANEKNRSIVERNERMQKRLDRRKGRLKSTFKARSENSFTL